MDHNDIRHKLSEYLDGAVTPQERAAMEEHLRICTECSDALAGLRKTIDQVKQLEEVEAPAWMTQRIMAQVRAAAEEKKSLFHRLFYPLAVKLPIQAVAMLFLTVTAYYLYSGMHPAEKYAEAPGHPAKQEAPLAAPEARKRQAPELTAPREKKAQQAPGYKSLDMKYAYVKPAPPEPRSDEAAQAPAPLRGAEQQPRQAGKAETGEQQAASPGAAPPARVAEQAAGAAPQAGPRREGSVADRKAGTTWSAVRSRVLKDDGAGSGSGDKEAEEMLSVTEHFVRSDLQNAMKMKGLQFNTRRMPDDLAGLAWMRDMPAYRSSTCPRKYLVDVEFSGRSSKYLYCYEKDQVRLLGIYVLNDGAWVEQK